MSVYNGEEFLDKAIISILNQSYKDFEFLIIDDGSTDTTSEIINRFKQKDERIRLFRNDINKGLIYSLNTGLQLINSDYIVRMDCDDISLPGRLEKQIRFMDSNPSIGVSGSSLLNINKSGTKRKWIPPSSHEDIKCLLLFNSSLFHPTVIIRRNALNNLNFKYDANYLYAEDYKLWTTLSQHVRLHNLKNVLLIRKREKESIGVRFNEKQKYISDQIRKEYLTELGFAFSPESLNYHNKIANYEREKSKQFIISSEEWLLDLLSQNTRLKCFDHTSFRTLLSYRWYHICKNYTHDKSWLWKRFWLSKLNPLFNTNIKTKLKFIYHQFYV